MKKTLALLLILASSTAMAYYEDPHEEFDMTRNMSNKTTVTFRPTANVQAACDAESRRLTGKGFGYGVDACSFWNDAGTQCTIITGPTANFHTIGHEMRHCIQGNFHNGKNK